MTQKPYIYNKEMIQAFSFDEPCCSSTKINPDEVDEQYILSIEEDMAMLEDMIADDLERGDYRSAASDRRLLQENRLYKREAKRILKMKQNINRERVAVAS